MYGVIYMQLPHYMKLLQYINVPVPCDRIRIYTCNYNALQTINYRGTTECMRQTLLECVITTCML